MGTFDPLGRLQGLTLIMHCIKYVLNVYYDIVWGPENANSPAPTTDIISESKGKRRDG